MRRGEEKYKMGRETYHSSFHSSNSSPLLSLSGGVLELWVRVVGLCGCCVQYGCVLRCVLVCCVLHLRRTKVQRRADGW